MRYSMMFIALLFLLACKDNSTQPTATYDSMLFVRQGGGNIVFNVYPTISTDTFQVTVSQYEFRDTTVHLILIKDNTKAASFDALKLTLSGQTQLVGDFKQSTLLTGTWSYLYMVKDGKRVEITKTDLRNILSNFENIVRTKLSV